MADDFSTEAIAATKAVLLPDLIRPEDFSRVVGIPLAEAEAFLREAGGAEIAGVVVIGRGDLLAAIRSRGGRP